MDINTQRRMLEIAGMTGVVLTESKKKTIKESLVDEFGDLGALVDNILEHFKHMATDPEFAGENSPEHMTPNALEGFVGDMIDDQLAEVFQSEAYKQKCAELAGQSAQVAANPDQRQLDV